MSPRTAFTTVVLAFMLSAAPASGRIVNWAHGSWSWFGDPRAVHVTGQFNETFVGWIGWSGNVTIGAYDPTFGVSRTHVVGRIFHDDHSAPSIFVEPDERLTVFWSGHDGQTLDYRSTLRPEDISAWGPLQHVRQHIRGNDGFTYPNPVLLPAEADALYLFWRGADWSVDYATRTLAGTWSPSRRLIVVRGQRPYLKVDTNGTDTIGLAFTQGHPRNVVSSIYYAAYRAGALWTAGGRRIALLKNAPIAPRQAQLVYDAKPSGIRSWVWDVAFGADQRPVIAYATFPTKTNHAYWYARFNGRRWTRHFMTFAGGTISPRSIEKNYSGGMALDHSNPSIVYLSREVHHAWEIQRWTTDTGGAHWRHTTVVPADGTDNVRPVVPRGWNGGPMGLLWLRGDYRTYTTYRTSIAFFR